MLIPSTVDSIERFGARKLEARATIRAGSACNKLPYRIDQLRTGHCHDDCLFPRHGGRVQSPD